MCVCLCMCHLAFVWQERNVDLFQRLDELCRRRFAKLVEQLIWARYKQQCTLVSGNNEQLTFNSTTNVC